MDKYRSGGRVALLIVMTQLIFSCLASCGGGNEPAVTQLGALSDESSNVQMAAGEKRNALTESGPKIPGDPAEIRSTGSEMEDSSISTSVPVAIFDGPPSAFDEQGVALSSQKSDTGGLQ